MRRGSPAAFATGVPECEAWDRSHLPKPRLVALGGEKLVGWAALSPISGREVYRGVAEVSVYIEQGRRGMGIGRALLEQLIARSESAAIWTLQASIFPENVPSIRLHESLGFRRVGRRERLAYHAGRWRDVFLLERRSAKVGID
jgi:L-amino acid N-acyltransferase YncA